MNSKHWMILAITLALLVALLLPACAKPAPKPAPAATPAPAPTGPQSGGVLKIITSPGVSNLGLPGPSYLPGETTLARPAAESLLNFDPKGTGGYVPQLAADYKWSSDYLHLTLTLRQGVKFQDGTDCNADAVKYNLDLYRVGWRPEIKAVTSVDIIDNYTVRLNLSAYSSSVLQGLCSLAGAIYSPTALKKLGDAAKVNPVGTGAFKFVSYQTETSLKYAKWDGYWQKGKPYLDGIEFVFIKDRVTQLVSFKAGEAQVMIGVLPKDVVEMQATGKYNFVAFPTAVMGIAGDSAHPDSIFADIRVRRAIAYAIDNEAIAKALGFGLYKAANQFFDSTGPYYNKGVVGYPYNPDKAKQLLSQAGYPNGFETKITFNAADSDQVAMMSAVQGFLSAVGIDAKLDAADPARLMALGTGGWRNQMIYHWTPVARGVPPSTSLSHMYQKGGTFDPKSLWIPNDYNALYEQAVAEPDPVKATALFQKCSKMVIDDYCVSIPIMQPFGQRATTKDVRDLDLRVYAMSEWLPENAWLSK